MFCHHCKQPYRLLDVNVCEHQTFSVFIYASHLKASILLAFALKYTVAWVFVCCKSEGAYLHGSTFSKLYRLKLFCFAQS